MKLKVKETLAKLLDTTPVGTVIAFAGTTSAIPLCWMKCDGRALSRTEYPALFAAIGTQYGSGDGSTTFNIPNLQGRFVLGAGNNGTAGSTTHDRGTSDGEEKHTLTINEMPSHDGHMYGNEAHSIPDQHENTYYVSVNSIPQYGTWKPWVLRNGNELVMKGFNKGGTQSHNNMPPFTTFYYLIYVGGG